MKPSISDSVSPSTDDQWLAQWLNPKVRFGFESLDLVLVSACFLEAEWVLGNGVGMTAGGMVSVRNFERLLQGSFSNPFRSGILPLPSYVTLLTPNFRHVLNREGPTAELRFRLL